MNTGYYVMVSVLFDDVKNQKWFYHDWRHRDLLISIFRDQ